MTSALKISIVTPNLNGAAFLEKTIRSVLDQGYPNLEYIVVDGGSTDGSMAIIDKYRASIAHVISEPDNGHTEAINKGFRLSTGEVMGWINSDDLLLPGSLSALNQIFQKFRTVSWVTARPTVATEQDILRAVDLRHWSWLRFLGGDCKHIQQESTFWRRELWDRAGACLSERHPLAADFELWTRFFRYAHLHSADVLLGTFRARTGQLSKVFAEQYEAECASALKELWHDVPALSIAANIEALSTELEPDTTRAEFDELLNGADAPDIYLNFGTSELEIAGEPPPLLSDNSSAGGGRTLTFDGTRSLTWDSGPDFSSETLVALDVALTSRVAPQPDRSIRSDTLPAMPMLVGPVSLYDFGGMLSIQVKTSVRTFVADAKVSGPIRLRVVVAAGTLLIIVNGNVLVREGTRGGTLTLEGPRAVVGSGYRSRHWSGEIAQLTVTTEDEQNRLHSYDIGCNIDNAGAHIALSPPTQSDISQFRNAFAGKRCFVMGNGPSLNKMDLTKLSGDAVFACNGAFLLFDRVAWRPRFYTCVDVRVIRDRAPEITQMLDDNPDMIAFFPQEIMLHDGSRRTFDTRTIIAPGPNRYYFNEIRNSMDSLPHSMFSINPNRYVVQPFTVAITMLQLAAYLGFNPIYLIGCDTSYVIPDSTKQEGRKIGGHGLLLTSTEDNDPNHFDPRYFGKGREWHNPQVGMMIEHHKWARAATDPLGIKIINATVGGQLEVYPRVDFNRLF